MKIKSLLIGLTAMLAMLISMQQPLSASTHSSCDCTAPEGHLYRGYGPNLARGSGALAKCPLFNQQGCEVGRTVTYAVGEDAVRHEWSLKDGSTLKIEILNGVTYFSPVDDAVVSSFPELASYLNNPNAGLLSFESNHSKHGDPAIVQWNGTGSFKKVNYIEFRCVYLTLNGNITECLGCHWFIGKK
jgi:hypothetical protein